MNGDESPEELGHPLLPFENADISDKEVESAKSDQHSDLETSASQQ